MLSEIARQVLSAVDWEANFYHAQRPVESWALFALEAVLNNEPEYVVRAYIAECQARRRRMLDEGWELDAFPDYAEWVKGRELTKC